MRLTYIIFRTNDTVAASPPPQEAQSTPPRLDTDSKTEPDVSSQCPVPSSPQPKDKATVTSLSQPGRDVRPQTTQKPPQRYRVAIVGHCQVPRSLDVEIENTEVRIFRAPGAKVENFFSDDRMGQILLWKHELTILWMGSNDINPNTKACELTQKILEIGRIIEQICGSKVIIVEIENRLYQASNPVISNERYKKIKRAINRALLKSKKFFCINFNGFEFTLGRDGMHFETSSKDLIQQKLARFIWKAKQQ